MTFVQQQDDYTCGVACAAMVAGVTFEAALWKADGIPQDAGLGPRELGRLLRRLGVLYTRQLIPRLDRAVPYIVTVASLNTAGGLHYVVADLSGRDTRVYDPQRGRTGRLFYRRRYDDADGVPMTAYAEVVRIDGVRAKAAP